MLLTNEVVVPISDITSLISIIVVILGGVFGYYQWHKSIQLKRAGYINELTEKIRTDKDIKKTIYILEYDEKWYSKKFHESGKKELKMDKTLSCFSYICYLKEQNIISDKEFDFFRYELKMILINEQMQDYLYNLYHYSQNQNVPCTFQYLINYGIESKVLDDDFCDKNAYKKYWKHRKYHNYIID